MIKPGFPPNQVLVDHLPFWWPCFWLGHDFQLTRVNQSWSQETCTRCPTTGTSRHETIQEAIVK